MRDCSAFITHVIDRAEHVRALPARSARRALAQRLVEDFVPALILGGIDVRRCMAPGVDAGHGPEEGRWSSAGFRHRLTAGGQNEEALRHLAAAAAVTLMGRHPLVWAASILDWLQGIAPGRRREAAAEIAGNRTGAKLGRALDAFLRGAMSRSALESTLRDLLCRED